MAQGRPPAIPLEKVGALKLVQVFEILSDSDLAALAKCSEPTVAKSRASIAPHTLPEKKSPGGETHGANDQTAGNDRETAMSPQLTPA